MIKKYNYNDKSKKYSLNINMNKKILIEYFRYI